MSMALQTAVMRTPDGRLLVSISWLLASRGE